MAFYDIFDELCKQRGVTPTRAARENGIAQSSVATWKKRGSTPKAATVQKLADYFGVSVSDLLSGIAGKAQFIEMGPCVNGFFLFDLGFLNFKLRSVNCSLLKDGFGIEFPDGDLVLTEAELWELDGNTDSYIRSKLNELREKHKDSFTPKAQQSPQNPAAPPAPPPEGEDIPAADGPGTPPEGE